MRLRNGRRHPQARLESHLLQFIRQMLHPVREKRIRLPFAVTILPAVIDNDPFDMSGKDRVPRDEFGVPEHFLLGDGPAVIVPGIPPGNGRTGKVFLHLEVFIAPAVYQEERIVAGRERKLSGIDLQQILMAGSGGAFEIRDGAGGGGSREICHEPVPERRGNHHETAPAFENREMVSLENRTSAPGKMKRNASAHPEILRQKMLGTYPRRRIRNQFDFPGMPGKDGGQAQPDFPGGGGTMEFPRTPAVASVQHEMVGGLFGKGKRLHRKHRSVEDDSRTEASVQHSGLQFQCSVVIQGQRHGFGLNAHEKNPLLARFVPGRLKFS
ncbi:MAG: hypothetical protein BWY31_04415 [Lentisphaerae bacterium ADurb.Bin242]|nr:MAG: hypothetical protein BWY31_04415 [Lentisphaerae bacterium ADurb.Bin242]